MFWVAVAVIPAADSELLALAAEARPAAMSFKLLPLATVYGAEALPPDSAASKAVRVKTLPAVMVPPMVAFCTAFVLNPSTIDSVATAAG